MTWRRAAIVVALLAAAGGTPAFADERRGEQPFRFPGTTPLPSTQPFRFPGTAPLPGIPPARVAPPRAMPAPPAQDGHHQRPVVVIVQPPPVYYYAQRPAGSWSYRWVPRYYETPTWVAGYWAPDGTWVEGHYESRWTDYGAWEPYWVPAY